MGLFLQIINITDDEVTDCVIMLRAIEFDEIEIAPD